MAIEFSCTHCQRQLRTPDGSGGQQARCPQCQTIVTVPNFTTPVRPATPIGGAGPAWNPPGTNAPEEFNPFQSPQQTGYVPGGSTSNQELASLGDRFVGTLLDGIIGIAVAIPGLLIGILIGVTGGEDAGVVIGMIVAGVGILGFNIYQWVLISKTGQSVGKRIVGTQILKLDGTLPGFVNGVALRMWVPGFIGGIPYLGWIFALADIFWIFGQERRRLSDLIASTRVIKVAAQ